MRKSIVVIGSKPNSYLPDISPIRVYTANSAALLAKKYSDAELVCVVGGSEIRKKNVCEAVLSSKAKKVIVRSKGFRSVKKSICEHKEVEVLGWKNQYDFQSGFFKWFYIWLYEIKFKYKKDLSGILRCLSFYIRHKRPQGVSNGLYAVLKALDDNPMEKIVVAGISLEGGEHFDKIGKMTKYRGLIDFHLFCLLNDRDKERLFTFDEDLADRADITFIRPGNERLLL